MNKITLTIALVFGFTIANAQDTTCTYFTEKRVIEFDYYQDTILYETKQIARFYDIDIVNGNILCLHLSDKKERVRKVIVTFFNGYTQEQVLNSKDDVYFLPQGAVKISVGKPRIAIKL
tara:strand:- start:261 stop:617 length:357 start_codon:yes stop_codon:yes gene_type:complete